MTAEVAVLNRSAVALAADSAVTVGAGTNSKVFVGANKIFALSTHEPVGIMIYGTADYCGVPWETLIKDFRGRLGRRQHPTLVDYATSFLDDLERMSSRLPAGLVEQSLQLDVWRLFDSVGQQVRAELQMLLKARTPIDPAKVDGIVGRLLDNLDAGLADKQRLGNLPESAAEQILTSHRALLDNALDQSALQRYSVSQEKRLRLLRLGARVLTLNLPGSPFQSSGVVVAGFGRDELFPTLYEAAVLTPVLGHRRVFSAATNPITAQAPAIVAPYAQTEVVEGFVQGAANGLVNAIITTMSRVLGEQAKAIAKNYGDLEEARLQKAVATWTSSADAFAAQFEELLRKKLSSEYSNPMVNTVASLPKDELARFAGALVELTSMRRRVSQDLETVAGAVDVAVISRGDGFVWIQRKHYFKPELNPQFMSRYSPQEPDPHGPA